MYLSIVTDTYPPDVNGVAMTLRRLRKAMQNLGHSVRVVRPKILGEAQSEDHPEADETPEIEVPSVPLFGYKGLRVGLPWGVQLRSMWSKERPDIIYIATESPLGLSAMWAANLLKIPIASGFHTNFHTYMAEYDLPILQGVADSYLRFIHNQTAATFAPSPDVAAKLQQAGYDNVKVLGRGVDTERFSPAHRDPDLRKLWGAEEDSPVAIYVGRIAAEKNLPLLVKSFLALRKSNPKTRCVLVGDGPKLGELEKNYPEFIFAGVRIKEDLARHYASADLFVFPSFTETFGNVVLEAMASGLLTISFDYAAPSIYIDHGANGYLAPFHDEESFLEACQRALTQWKNPELKAAARETTESISWESIAQQFARQLQELIPASPEK
ncbi:MAG: glycosyltransferase family 1 protein [Verrucomicrobiota bacterium]